MGWRQIFFEQKLQPISGRLQQAKRTDPGGPPAILHVAHHLSLQPNCIRDGGQQYEQHDRRLNYRREYVEPDWQHHALLPLSQSSELRVTGYEQQRTVLLIARSSKLTARNQSAATSAGFTS